jgi:hypothetical protein
MTPKLGPDLRGAVSGCLAKPGPKPLSTITDLWQQLRDRERRIAELDNLLRIAQDRLGRQHLTLPGVAGRDAHRVTPYQCPVRRTRGARAAL